MFRLDAQVLTHHWRVFGEFFRACIHGASVYRRRRGLRIRRRI
jgi:hypothetical protein